METRTEETAAAHVEITLEGWSPRQREHADPTPPPLPARLPRITRLMALAIKFQDMVDRGEVRDYADLARLGPVTRAPLAQIMNLLLLAPGIQEEILIQADTAAQPLGLSERTIRPVAHTLLWSQ